MVRTMAVLRVLAVVAALASATVWGADAAPRRIVAVADVHGAYPPLVQLLGETGIVDKDANWSGGSTHLVSLGDLLDRGAQSRAVLDLMIKLQQQAKAAGGAVHVVLGNHETMVMAGDLRYVSAPEFAAFAAEETAAEREQALAAYTAASPGADPQAVAAAFAKAYPPGRIALQKAFAPEGRYGAWLLAQPMMLKLGDSVFMHGGVSWATNELAPADANTRLARDFREHLDLVSQLRASGALPLTIGSPDATTWFAQQLDALDKARGKAPEPPAWAPAAQRLIELDKSMAFDENGPLWYRGSARCHPYVTAFDVEKLLKKWDARRLIVGHTPTDSHRVVSRLDGTVLVADTGMLAEVYHGRASAIVIEGTQIKVHYAGEPGEVAPEPEVARVPRQPADMDDAAMERFLLSANVIANDPIGTGVTKPRKLTLEMDGRQLNAVYKPYDSEPGLQTRERYRGGDDKADRYIYEVAAYKLDRALGIDRVPVSVERAVNGVPGLVQAWVTGTINERDRIERGVAMTAMCPMWDQYRMRIWWDILVYNEDRNLTNLLWTDDDFTLLLIDHSLAFRSATSRPKQYAKVRIDLPDILRARLAQLDQEKLTALLGAYLHPVQIKALLARRDLLLREAQPTGFTY